MHGISPSKENLDFAEGTGTFRELLTNFSLGLIEPWSEMKKEKALKAVYEAGKKARQENKNMIKS